MRSDPLPVQLLVVAKEPVPGRVKTRLCPPLTPEGAAAVAAAAIEDTLDAVRAVPVARRVLVLDGAYDAPGFDVQPQALGPFDRRLGAAFDDAAAGSPLPALLIGMDTPQVTPALLRAAVDALLGADAVLGPADDGGWWALGLRVPDGDLLRGVETSRADTGARQRARLVDAGLRLVDLPPMRDVDEVADARAAAALAPTGRFATALAAALADGAPDPADVACAPAVGTAPA